MANLLVRGKLVAVAVVALALAGCAPSFRNHGYAPDKDQLEQIQVGVTTRQDVADFIGRPSTYGVLSGGDWYYVQSRFRHQTYQAPKEVDREVVAIRFNRDVVANVERYGLEDGRVVTLSRRVTEGSIPEISFLRQLLGTLGRVDPASILNDSSSPF